MGEQTENLRALRHRLDLSQQAMADRLGVHLRTWQAWEYGEASPPGNLLERALRDLTEEVRK